MQRKTLHKQYKKLGISAVRRIGFSFFAVILIGSILLSLPMSHSVHSTSSYLDHLFVATSATCVTGLVTHVTASEYTLFGQIVIILLIQIGGLGFLTLMSMFFVLLKRKLTYANKIVMQEALNRNSLNETGIYIKRVIKYTVCFELIGAICLAFVFIPQFGILKGIYYSLFHAISAFCNAGFSILSAGLYDEGIRFDYYLQWILITMIVLGGLGHNIVFNFYQKIKTHVVEFFDKTIIHKKVRIITLNTQIVIYTTLVLLIGGFIFLYISEYNNTLLEHQTTFGKITAAAFNSVTPRTAGFNAVDFTQMNVPSLLFIIFLMWIGGSPASTAGGIKTSTFALATLNIFAVASGKSRIQLFGRRISSESTSRAFAILCISLITIGISIVALLIFEPKGTPLLTVAFECFSAYSTVGLTLNFTPTLTEPSKYVLIACMFIGRIGMLNLMVGLLRRLNHQFYEYPKENILIN